MERVTDSADDWKYWHLWEALDDLPEGVKAEIVDGELRVLPRPGPPHLRVASRLGTLIDGPFGLGRGGPGGWIIIDEPGIRFGDEMRIPDLAGWRVSAYGEPGRGPYVATPDWLCEVLSPSTAREDRARKLPLYGRHGVGHVWIVDPLAQTIEVYRREGDLWVVAGVHAGDAVVRPEPFDAVDLELALLWPKD